MSDYTSEQIQRTLRVIKVLAGNEVSGLSPKQIGERANLSKTNVTRAIANLEVQKFVEPLPTNTKHFRLTAIFLQISNTVSASFNQANLQLQQDIHNYSRIA